MNFKKYKLETIVLTVIILSIMIFIPPIYDLNLKLNNNQIFSRN